MYILYYVIHLIYITVKYNYFILGSVCLPSHVLDNHEVALMSLTRIPCTAYYMFICCVVLLGRSWMQSNIQHLRNTNSAEVTTNFQNRFLIDEVINKKPQESYEMHVIRSFPE